MKAHTMIPIQTRTPRSALLLGSFLGSVLLLPAGCGYSKVAGPRSASLERLSINDFQAQDADPTPPPAQADPVTTPSVVSTMPAARTEVVTLKQPNPSPRPVEISQPLNTENTPETQSSASNARPLQLLDAKVGDVNGKPIFTSSFFAPIEDRLIAEAQRLPINEWRGSAGRIISQRLDGIIADELLRAEALAALTPTQRVGLQAFLNNFRDNLLSENLGSSQLATRRIQQREGLTLDEALKQKEIDTLVQLTLIKEINRRVNVSWRDIKQRYDRDIDEFAPPPTAVLRVIRVFKDNADKVQSINDRLLGGEDFGEIAGDKSINTFNPEVGGTVKQQLKGSFEETKFFGPDVLNDAARSLQIGEQTGPIELGSSVYWIKLVDMEQESISLYDAQLQIQRDLTYERRDQARQQYFDRLQERARVSTRDQVLLRLFEIAEQRYAPRQ